DGRRRGGRARDPAGVRAVRLPRGVAAPGGGRPRAGPPRGAGAPKRPVGRNEAPPPSRGRRPKAGGGSLRQSVRTKAADDYLTPPPGRGRPSSPARGEGP